jgi:hypothetical protein
MPLFWMAYTGEPRVFIADSGGEIGMLKASMAGMEGRPAETYMLDEKTERKIPKAMIGRALSQREAKALLKKIGS